MSELFGQHTERRTLEDAVARRLDRPILRGVSYDDYVKLRNHPRNRGLRITYHNGSLEIMSPEYRHENSAELLGVIVRATASIFSIPCRGSGRTTFRRRLDGAGRGVGKEPDQSFYLARAPQIRNLETLDMSVSPPPDLWIEVDNRASSAGRLPLYAALEVPEVWSYRARRATLWFGKLDGDHYVEIDRSLNLPMLTPKMVLELLSNAASAPDDSFWDQQTRTWLRETLKPAYEAGPQPASG